MKRIILSVIVAGAMLAGAGAATISANPVSEGCDKVQIVITCTTTETAGNAPEHSSAQRVIDTTVQKASLESSHESVVTCDGPPGQCK